VRREGLGAVEEMELVETVVIRGLQGYRMRLQLVHVVIDVCYAG
jgi:hypothetical protein